jgi:hypothetical protein
MSRAALLWCCTALLLGLLGCRDFADESARTRRLMVQAQRTIGPQVRLALADRRGARGDSARELFATWEPVLSPEAPLSVWGGTFSRGESVSLVHTSTDLACVAGHVELSRAPVTAGETARALFRTSRVQLELSATERGFHHVSSEVPWTDGELAYWFVGATLDGPANFHVTGTPVGASLTLPATIERASPLNLTWSTQGTSVDLTYTFLIGSLTADLTAVDFVSCEAPLRSRGMTIPAAVLTRLPATPVERAWVQGAVVGVNSAADTPARAHTAWTFETQGPSTFEARELR